MKKFVLITLAAMLLLSNCASTGSTVELMSMDEAINAIATEIESKVAGGSAILVYRVVSFREEVGVFVCDELTEKFSGGGKLKPIAREAALRYTDAEQQFQMSGQVSDASAVAIGQYLGAKAVIIGDFSFFKGFNQLRFRAVDVDTEELITLFDVRIRSNDPLLASVTKPLGNLGKKSEKVTDEILDLLNQGRYLWAEDKHDEAIAVFDKVIALNKKLAEAYFHRANMYREKGEMDKALADYNQVIRLDSTFVSAYNNRGFIYDSKEDFDHAIADYNAAIRLNPDYASAYNGRGSAYSSKENYNRAIEDFSEAIRLDPYDTIYWHNRGATYSDIENFDKAIADLTESLRLDPDFVYAYNNRGFAYYQKGEIDKAIADFESVLRINPDSDEAKQNLDYIRQRMKN